MAIVAQNTAMQNLSGTLGGDVVFKKYADKTVVCMKASPRRKNSPLQQLYLNKFKDASRYAREVLRDPAKREHYGRLAKKLKKHSAYNVVISEYMLSIRITSEDGGSRVSEDRKRVTIKATKKDFKVKEVAVQVLSADGEVIDEGKANRINATDWVLKLKQAPARGSALVVTAVDALGLATIRELWV